MMVRATLALNYRPSFLARAFRGDPGVHGDGVALFGRRSEALGGIGGLIGEMPQNLGYEEVPLASALMRRLQEVEAENR
jgi:hypothetical protein